jgi:hypothetical protein
MKDDWDIEQRLEELRANCDRRLEELTDEYQEFLERVQQMRDSQKLYFQTRSNAVLIQAKAFEKAVDEALADPTPAKLRLTKKGREQLLRRRR